MDLAPSAIAALSSTRAAYPPIYQRPSSRHRQGRRRCPRRSRIFPFWPSPRPSWRPRRSTASASFAGLHASRPPSRAPRGAIAAAALDAFDYYAAEAIATGAVGIEVYPLDICLGVLPPAQLALRF
jgi:hypothetical protein